MKCQGRGLILLGLWPLVSHKMCVYLAPREIILMETCETARAFLEMKRETTGVSRW